jgi:hypothetical protein
MHLLRAGCDAGFFIAFSTFLLQKRPPMKLLLFILLLVLATLPTAAAIRERRGAPLLHSVVDEKAASDYMQPYERSFLPDGNTVVAKPTHGQTVMGTIFGGVGLSIFAIATYLYIANPAGRNSGPNDVAMGDSSRPLALGLMAIGLALLVSGMLLLTETHRGAPKRKKSY